MKIGEVIYEEIDGVETIPFKFECIGIKGIWALYGKEEIDSEYTCLNVGKSADVGREIIYDLGCLHHLTFRKDGTEEYVNQFNVDCDFNYISGQTQEYLYPYIALRFRAIKFIYIYDDNNSQKEREYAEINEAFFWRNGGAYEVSHKTNWNRKDLQTVGDYFCNGGEFYSLEELLMKIETDLGYDHNRGKRLINECVRLGIVYCVGNNEYTR